MFVKRIEDFICEHCNVAVKGDGFTNHCPNCLWSKHVDINPGDRKETCGGLMEPIEIVSKREGESIIHRCVVCGKERKNRLAQDDNFQAVLEVTKKRAENF